MVYLSVLVELRSSSGVTVPENLPSPTGCVWWGSHSCPHPHGSMRQPQCISYQSFVEQPSRLFSSLQSCTSGAAAICDLPADAQHRGKWDIAEEHCSSCPSPAVVQQPPHMRQCTRATTSEVREQKGNEEIVSVFGETRANANGRYIWKLRSNYTYGSLPIVGNSWLE